MWSIDFGSSPSGNTQANVLPMNLCPPNFVRPDSVSNGIPLLKVKSALAVNPLPAPVGKLISIGYMDHLPLWTFYWHFHDDASELTIVESGHGLFHVGDHAVPISRGCVCLVPRFMLHYFSSQADDPLKYYVIELDCSDTQSALYPWLTSDFGRVIRLERYSEHLFFAIDTLNARLKKNKLAIDAEFQASVFALASWIRDHPEDAPEELYSPQGFVLNQVLTYISSHYFETISLDDLCRMLNTSPANLNRLFNRHCGMSPINYVIYYRITQALRLLQYTELAVFDVANAVGYQNQTHFSRHFSRFMGCTPAHFRKQLRAMFSEFSQI